MTGDLQQSVVNATGDKIGAGIASMLTAIFGGSVYYDLVPAVLGGLSALPLWILSCVLVYGQIKKGRLERKQLHMQLAILEEKEAERLDRARSRETAGEPVRREDDHSGHSDS